MSPSCIHLLSWEYIEYHNFNSFFSLSSKVFTFFGTFCMYTNPPQIHIFISELVSTFYEKAILIAGSNLPSCLIYNFSHTRRNLALITYNVFMQLFQSC